MLASANLHDDGYCVAEDGDGGGEHQRREHEGAHRVQHRQLRPQVDSQGSREHAWAGTVLKFRYFLSSTNKYFLIFVLEMKKKFRP